MGANIEVKANLRSAERQFELAAEIAGQDATRLIQCDTFFTTAHGRLKLREIQGETAQLIHYFRSNDPAVRKSDYVISSVIDPDSMKLTLQRSNGIRGIVSKVRSLWIVGQTRIHFDSVENLGKFAELEFVLKPNQPEQEGLQFVHELMSRLEILESDVIDCAYIDMIETTTLN